MTEEIVFCCLMSLLIGIVSGSFIMHLMENSKFEWRRKKEKEKYKLAKLKEEIDWAFRKIEGLEKNVLYFLGLKVGERDCIGKVLSYETDFKTKGVFPKLDLLFRKLKLKYEPETELTENQEARLVKDIKRRKR